MTPLEPLVPYMATADASFNISIEAISLGFISLSEPPVLLNGMPSTTTYGPVPALMEFCPRTIDPGTAPGTDDVLVMVTPATAPSKACSTFVTGNSDKRAFGTDATAPVISD